MLGRRRPRLSEAGWGRLAGQQGRIPDELWIHEFPKVAAVGA